MVVEPDASATDVVIVVAQLPRPAPHHPAQAPAPHQIFRTAVHALSAAAQRGAQANALISQMHARLAWQTPEEADASMMAAASAVTAPLPLLLLLPPVQALMAAACTAAQLGLAKNICWRQQGPTANQAPSWRSSWLSVRTNAIPSIP